MFNLRTLALGKAAKAVVKLSLLIVVLLVSFGGIAVAAPPDTTRIWRAQVRFVTANIDDAGSDDSVKIELNAGNRTWINSAWDDFERNTDLTYDLRLEGVNQLSDIDYFRIEKTGSNGWAIRHMFLIINGATIYHEEFAPGLWLDNDGGHSRVYFIDDFFMRPRTHWLNYPVPVRPNIVPLNDMRLRIESIIGDFVTTDHMAHHSYGYGGLLIARFGSHSVEPYTLNANTWRVDLDMEEDGTFFDVDIDVDFDLTASCSNGRPNFTVMNVNADSTLDRHETDRARAFVNNQLRLRLNEMMKNFSYFQCPNILLAVNGDLYFNPRYIPPVDAVLVADDNLAPLSLHVVTGDQIKSFAETIFTATVKSKLEKDAEVDVNFELPAQIVLSDAIIEAQDADGKRRLVAKIVKRDDGTSLITVRDRVTAERDTEYKVRLMFQPREDKTEQVNIFVEPVTPELAAQITPLRANTLFRFSSGSINPEGTIIESSKYISPDDERNVVSK